ncbi:hypothetical protein [Corynebacterium xerosis]|uniref:Uncharacterized protein n=1 Tax=Corynebacterium xerosis TaxID=1725 RepID=A0ABV3UY78_9CORY
MREVHATLEVRDAHEVRGAREVNDFCGVRESGPRSREEGPGCPE